MTTSAITFLERRQIDDVKWNSALDGSINRNIYAYSWYLDAVSPGWCALVEGDYKAIMPLPIRKKMGVHYAFMPPYCQQLGIYSSTIVDSDKMDVFLKSIPMGIRFVDMNFNAQNPKPNLKITSEKRLNLVLELGRSFEEVQNRYSTNHKRNVRKFQDSGLMLDNRGNLDEVIKLFETGRGGRLGRYPDSNHDVFRRLVSAVQIHAHVEILVARNASGMAVGGAVFFEAFSGSYFIFSGLSGEGRGCSVMHGLVDHYLKSQFVSLRFLDFEGSNNPELARFYAGFGADESVYLHFVMNRLPFPFNYLKPR